MDEVFILNAGRVPAVKYDEDDVARLAARAIKPLLDGRVFEREEVTALYVGNMLSGILSNQQLLAPLIAQHAMLTGCEAITAEAACGSGAAAMRQGVMAIASGYHSLVLVAGAEQMSRNSREEVSRGLATASCWEREGGKGETFITLNARIMKSYMETYATERSAFSHFAVNAHSNAAKNDCAMLQKAITTDDYENGRMLANPIGLFDAPPICDGASALLLGNREMARRAQRLGMPVVKVLASTCATDALAIEDRQDPLALAAARDSFTKAYKISGVTAADIDLFEPHDAYTVMTALSLEAAGFAKPGTATHMAAEGMFSKTGSLPITSFGGLKARGHPVGATGVYQLAECFLQLTEQAGELQVPGVNLAMAQNLGGAAGSAFTHILERI